MVEHIKTHLENALPKLGSYTTEQLNIYPSAEIKAETEKELDTLATVSKAVEDKQNAILALIRNES